METAVRYFAHVQNKLQEVLEHELPNIEKAADFVVERCKQGGNFYVFGTYRRVCEGIALERKCMSWLMVAMSIIMLCLKNIMDIGNRRRYVSVYFV